MVAAVAVRLWMGDEIFFPENGHVRNRADELGGAVNIVHHRADEAHARGVMFMSKRILKRRLQSVSDELFLSCSPGLLTREVEEEIGSPAGLRLLIAPDHADAGEKFVDDAL